MNEVFNVVDRKTREVSKCIKTLAVTDQVKFSTNHFFNSLIIKICLSLKTCIAIKTGPRSEGLHLDGSAITTRLYRPINSVEENEKYVDGAWTERGRTEL